MPYVKRPITYPTGKVSEQTEQINVNFSILADAFYNSDPENSPIYRGAYVGISAPLNPKVGQIWVDTSVIPPLIKVYNGTSWLEVKPASVEIPTTPYVGQLWLDTSVNPPVLKIYDGTNWQSNVSNANYANNADTVDGFHASLTPAPNVIVPLNASGILDLSATYVKSSVYTFRRVDLTNATSDYMLQVGEEAIIYVNNQQIVPLHIATQDGTVYEMIISDSGQPAYLYPNNTSYSNQFASYRIYACVSSGNWILGIDGSTTLNQSAFFIWSGSKRVLIFNQTSYKRLFAHYADVSGYHHGIFASFWSDTTTPWTSLGTFDLSWNIRGFILVRRLV